MANLDRVASLSTLSALNGNAKAVYGDEMVPLYSDVSKFLKMVKFNQAKKIGSGYKFPVALTYESGFSFGATGDGAFPLYGPTSMTTKEVTVDATQIVLQSQISYDCAAKSQGSEAAFKAAAGLVVENAQESLSNRLEGQCLYGSHSLGTISAKSGTYDAAVLTITTADWAPALWCGLEGANIAIHANSGGNPGTLRDVISTITKVDADNKQLTCVVGTASGHYDAVTVGDHILLMDALSAEMEGLFRILSNNTTMFGIDASVYSLWKSSTYSAASGRLSLAKILKGVAMPVAKGLLEKTTGFVSIATWADLASDFNASRVFDSSYNEQAKAGVLSISFVGPNGEIEIVPHPMVKEGHAMFVPVKRVKRIGGSDVTNKVPGRGDEMFFNLATKAGFEFRLYSDQAICLTTPAKGLLINNIVNG